MFRAHGSHHLYPAALANGCSTGIALVALAFAQSAPAAIIAVNTVSDVVAVDGLCSLREAITAVNKQAASGNMTGECAAGDGNNDTIIVPSGTYTLSIAGIDEDNNASGDLDIRASVTVQGARIGYTIIDANDIDRVLDIPVGSVSVRLNDLGLYNGHAPDSLTTTGESGGAINNPHGANLFLTRVDLAGNSSGSGGAGFGGGAGGGILSNGGNVQLFACDLENNSTGSGGNAAGGPGGFAGSGGNGGAIATSASNLGIEQSWFSFNRTGDGGTGGIVEMPGFGAGIYANGGSVTVLQSAFDANSTSSQINGGSGAGGGLFVYSTVTHITQASFTHNAAFDGGGIDSGDSALILSNVTLSGNYAGQFGGGLFVFGGTGQLDFVTLSANQAAIDSGGTRIENGNSGAATVAFRNSILSGNSAPSLPDCNVFGGNTLTSQGYNLAGNGCPSNAIGDVATSNPHLGPLGDNGGIGLTQMSAPDGPAIDGGNCLASSTGVDERGHARFVDVPRAPNAADACDIGASELDDDIFWNGFQ